MGCMRGLAVESLNHNGILHAQVVERQIVGLPSETLISIEQIQQVESSEEVVFNYIYACKT